MNIFLTSIQSIIPIIAIIVLGYILQVRGWFRRRFRSQSVPPHYECSVAGFNLCLCLEVPDFE